jgi:anti-sigma B factor antagonist
MPIEIIEKESRGIIILEPSGRLVLGPESMHFRDKVKEVLEESGRTKEKWGWSSRLVLDLGSLTFVDSSGLGALIAARISAANSGSEMKLANLTKRLRDTLAITKLATVFDVYDSTEAAVNSYFPPAPGVAPAQA